MSPAGPLGGVEADTPYYAGATNEVPCKCPEIRFGYVWMRRMRVLCCMNCGSTRLIENTGTGLGHEERIRVLEEALAPFARYATHMADRWGATDDSAYFGVARNPEVNVTYGDFRRAAKVIKKV